MARKLSKKIDERLDTRINNNSPFPTSGVRGANKKGHDQSCSVPTASYKWTWDYRCRSVEIRHGTHRLRMHTYC